MMYEEYLIDCYCDIDVGSIASRRHSSGGVSSLDFTFEGDTDHVTALRAVICTYADHEREDHDVYEFRIRGRAVPIGLSEWGSQMHMIRISDPQQEYWPREFCMHFGFHEVIRDDRYAA
jgi:hypothetical protein